MSACPENWRYMASSLGMRVEDIKGLKHDEIVDGTAYVRENSDGTFTRRRVPTRQQRGQR